MRGLFLTILMSVFVMAGGLVTGESKKFVPGDKVVFSTDFSKCPVGDLPTEFEKLEGAGECVKYNDKMWLAPSTDDDFKVYKKIDLGDDEFAIEFDYLAYQENGGPDFLLTLFKSKGKEWDRDRVPRDLSIHEDYKAYTFYLERAGNIGRFKNFHRKRIHVAVQVRRHQLRVYANGKRLTAVPFNLAKGEHISGIRFMFYDDTYKYGEFITNIKITKYTTKEKKPEPEKLGINVTKTDKGYSLNIPEKVLFDFNKFTLKDEAKKALDVVGAFIKEKNIKQIRVIGYTDNIGSDEYNLKLSLQRAQSVADYLINCAKIDAKLFKIEGKGKANPIAPNDSDENRAKNRRVEIKLETK